MTESLKAIIQNCGHQTSSSAGDSALDRKEILVPKQKPLFSEASRIIQRAWRRHVDTAVFKHLKKLVNFHNKGDPRLFLRFINPVEAKILDAASGAIVRFRLGGTSYPPDIYYKIYTRAPVVDMCASSPKDYTRAQQIKLVPGQIHNGQLMICADDHSGWYQRVENNGWRMLSCRISAFKDPIAQDTNCKKIEFHYCRINRQQDVARKRKIRKIEWMRKMYAVGLQDSETSLLMQKSTQRLMNSLEQIKPDSVTDKEVDDLLAWTNSLNFDEYINEWMDLGTSTCRILNKHKVRFLGSSCLRVAQINQDEVVTQHETPAQFCTKSDVTC